MKSVLIAGNWKSNKTTEEATKWLEHFNAKCQVLNAKWQSTTIVLFVPFTFLAQAKYFIEQMKLPIGLGAQDVSAFGAGAFTGAVNALQIKELAQWVIVGHSERRKYFGEIDDVLAQKVSRANEAGLKIIYCVPDAYTVIPAGVDIVAYEPVWAIGTGKSDTPENANTVIGAIKKIHGIKTVIYGGSVTDLNVASFIHQADINGVLPGGASLDPEKFYQLIHQASSISYLP